MRRTGPPRVHMPHYDHAQPCQCEPCHRDSVSAIVPLFRTAADCARRWGWTEAKLIRLLRVCWAWERDGEIPKRLDDDPPDAP